MLPIRRKSKAEIEKMRDAGRIVGETLIKLKEAIRPGLDTLQLHIIAMKMCEKYGVEPAFLGYQGYPAAVCVSINDEVVHGIPSADRFLKEGDLVSMDFGIIKDGWYGDAAITAPVGEVGPEAERLIRVTRESLYKAIEQMKPGNHVHDIGLAVQEHVEPEGFSVVRDFVGHGIGKKMHEEPQVPNYRSEGIGWSAELRPGMVIAIEPMINQGTYEVKILKDKWTAVTKDGKLSAHFEQTVAVTENGADILSWFEGM